MNILYPYLPSKLELRKFRFQDKEKKLVSCKKILKNPQFLSPLRLELRQFLIQNTEVKKGVSRSFQDKGIKKLMKNANKFYTKNEVAAF